MLNLISQIWRKNFQVLHCFCFCLTTSNNLISILSANMGTTFACSAPQQPTLQKLCFVLLDNLFYSSCFLGSLDKGLDHNQNHIYPKNILYFLQTLKMYNILIVTVKSMLILLHMIH